uniref:Uncharacterized protein n=1 Tax=Strongyloides venezuelensis TaxID=75913 RepID=A0A0K0F7Y1_STRVS
MDPRRKEAPRNDNRGTFYDYNLRQFIPSNDYIALEEKNKFLEKMNEDLHNLIKEYEDSEFLRSFSSDKIKLETERLREFEKKLEGEKLDMCKNLAGMDDFFDSTDEDGMSLNEPLGKENNEIRHELPPEIPVTVDEVPIKKEIRFKKLIPSNNNHKSSVDRLKKKSIKEHPLTPIHRSELRRKGGCAKLSLNRTLFSKKEIEKFTEIVANKNILYQEVVATQAKGPGDIDLSNIKYEADFDTRLTRSMKEQKKKYKDICFYRKVHAQLWSQHCVLEDDLKSGVMEMNVEEEAGFYFFN